MFSNFTKKLTGVDKSRDASDEIKSKLIYKSFDAHPAVADRYAICSECSALKEEFKLFGKTIKNETPVCGECGCSLWLKIPLQLEECPLGKW
jgi:transcription elongation factor Elf1